MAVDDSDCGRVALRFAADLARRLGEPLHVLTVWNLLLARAPERTGDAVPTEAEWQAHAQQRLDALVAEALPGADRPELQAHAVHGNVVPTLLEVTRHADHLVVGSRGRGGFAGLVLGSTSEQLVRHGECPVTVVHGSRPRGERR